MGSNFRLSEMDIIKENLGRIKVPGPGDKVFKDECFYSFDNPVTPESGFKEFLRSNFPGEPIRAVCVHE